MQKQFFRQPLPVAVTGSWKVPRQTELMDGIIVFKFSISLKLKYILENQWTYNSICLQSYVVEEMTEAAVSFHALTFSTISRMSRSGQSLIVTGAVSSEPPKRTWTMVGLSPGKLGPLCKKEWPIIRPAMVNTLFSSSSSDTEGIRWSDSPSNILVTATPPAAVMVSV